MSFTFSHVMCTVPTLPAGDVAFGNLGFTVAKSGQHKIGTQSSDVPLERGYLELVSIYDVESARRSPRRRSILEFIEREHGGMMGFALRTDTMSEDAQRLNDSGLNYGGPIEAQRAMPDGQIFPLEVLRPSPQPYPALFPVIVTGHVSVPPFVGHPNTVTGAAGISVVGHDAAQLVESYRTLLDADPVDLRDRPDLGARATVFTVGDFDIELLEVTDMGVAQRTLSRQGAGPVELHLRADDLTAVAEPLGLGIAHDAVVIPAIMACGVRTRVTTK